MKNKTQCPNCLTIYVISDEQYMRSKGKVRCGTCRTPFQANFFADTPKPVVSEPPEQTSQTAIDNKITAASKNIETENSTEKLTIPSFNIQLPEKQPAPYDDQLLPIEKDDADSQDQLSSESKVSVDKFIAEKVDLVSEDDGSFSFETELSVNDLSDEELEEYAAEQFHDDEGESGEVTKLDHSFKNNIQSELSIEMGDEPDIFDEEIVIDEENDALPDQQEAEHESRILSGEERALEADEPTAKENAHPQQADLQLDSKSSDASKTDSDSLTDTAADEGNSEPELDQKLISKVDELIDDKLGSDPENKAEKVRPEQEVSIEDANDSGEVKEDHSQTKIVTDDDLVDEVDGEIDEESFELLLDKPFILEQPVNKVHRWVYSPILILVSLIFIATLAYQLWLRQATPILEDKRLSDAVAPIAGPLTSGLKDKFDITLPVRRDLANLQLVSARTETHPTRASTTLLKVSMVNQSQIAQPFPWLELSLTDENGRLVARRALSPDDYLYNNRLDNLIGANELRPVTIELLSFPEQARGYELKLLSN